jgi:hypothetical protein
MRLTTMEDADNFGKAAGAAAKKVLVWDVPLLRPSGLCMELFILEMRVLVPMDTCIFLIIKC